MLVNFCCFIARMRQRSIRLSSVKNDTGRLPQYIVMTPDRHGITSLDKKFPGYSWSGREILRETIYSHNLEKVCSNQNETLLQCMYSRNKLFCKYVCCCIQGRWKGGGGGEAKFILLLYRGLGKVQTEPFKRITFKRPPFLKNSFLRPWYCILVYYCIIIDLYAGKHLP